MITPKLGQRGRDVITLFTGRVIGRSEYISGCTQLLLQPSVDEKGAVPEARWIDEQRIDLDGHDIIVLNNATTPGCDIPAPIR